MSNKKVYLTYSAENQDVANQLIADLGRVGIEFIQDTRNPVTKAANENRMALDDAPIYLLISDNFLKSVDCMEGALKFIDNFKFRPRIKPVVIDGRFKNEATGRYETAPTKFDKVSNVIRYMNYWQDEYLRLRREKRTIPYSEEAAFQAKIDRIRRISNEIGEFLRSLRSFNYVEYAAFESNKFKRFFDNLGFDGQHLYQQYSMLPPVPKVLVEEPKVEIPIMETPVVETPEIQIEESVVEIPEPVVEIDTPSIEVNIEDNTKDTKSMLETLIENNTDSEDVNLGDIPGISDLYKEDEIPVPVYEEDEEEEDEIEVEGDTPVSEDSQVAPTNEESSFIPSASESFNSAEDFVESELEEMTEEVMEVVDEVEEETTEEVTEVVDEVEEETTEEVTEVVDEVEEETTEEVMEVVDEVEEETTEEVTEVVDEVEEETTEEVMEVVDEVEEEMTEEVTEVVDEVEEEETTEIISELVSGVSEVEVEETEELEELINEVAEVEETEDVPVVRTAAMILKETEQLIAAGDFNGAKENYELMLLKSSDGDVKLAYASLLQDKMYDDMTAKVILEDLMLQDLANSEVYSRLGRIAENNQEYLVAKNYYERAITLNNHSAYDYNRLGNIIYKHFENKDFVAKSYLQEAVNLSPEDAALRHDLAKFLIQKGEYKKARKQLLEVIDLDEEDATAYMSLANLYLNHLDKKKKARKYYTKAVNIDEELISDENDTSFGVVREVEEESMEASQQQETETVTIKTVLITGATSGIGLATARTLAAQGHNLILTGRRADRLAELKEVFQEEYGVEVTTLNFDVRNNDATETILNSLSDELKEVDVLINNAGLAKGFEPIQAGSLDHWNTMIDTNIKGLLYVSRVVAPWMVKRGEGYIINIASIAGKEAYPNGAVYCATKAAVDQLTKGMRLDLYKHNIRVSSISPAHVEETEFALVRFDGDTEKAKIYNDFNPLTSSDVAATIDFMLSQPAHVCLQDVVISGTQQASATNINRSGRDDD